MIKNQSEKIDIKAVCIDNIYTVYVGCITLTFIWLYDIIPKEELFFIIEIKAASMLLIVLLYNNIVAAFAFFMLKNNKKFLF